MWDVIAIDVNNRVTVLATRARHDTACLFVEDVAYTRYDPDRKLRIVASGAYKDGDVWRAGATTEGGCA